MSESQIKLLHILPSLEAGGMENGVVNVVNGLDDRFNASILCLETLGALSNRINKNKVDIKTLNKPPGKTPGLIFTLAKIFKREKYDIVHTHNKLTLEYAVPAALLSGVPVVIHGLHGATPKPGRMRRAIYRLLYSRIDAMMLVSDALRNDVTNKWRVDDNKIHTIINGVNSERFYPKNKNMELARRHNISDDEFIIGSVGRLSPVKNFNILVDLVAELKNKGKKVKGIIVGDGPERSALASHVQDKGLNDDFILVGESDEIPDYLATMDLFVLPSLSEGMSNSILEAMSCGKAIIATDVGGNAELVTNEINGLLIKPDQLESLLNAVMRLIDNPDARNKMGQESRRIIEKKYSLKQMVENYASFYSAMFLKKV